MRRDLLLPSLILAALLCSVPAFAGAPAYEPVARIAGGAEGGWDLLAFDAATRRLYVSRSFHVQVFDLASDSLVGDVPDTPGVHGIALAPDFGHGFTSNGRDSSVTVFDLKTLAKVATVKLAARNPDAILYEPVTRRIFTLNGGSGSATAIDAATNTMLGTVALAGKPELAVADGRGRVFVNLEDRSEIACFDAKTLKVLSTWPIAPGEEPTGLAFDAAHRRLFAACSNHKLIVVEADHGKVVADLPIGEHVDGATFDDGLQRVVTSNGEGTLSVFHEDTPDRYTALADVPTERGARTVALDPVMHRVITCTARFGEAPPATPEHPRPRPPIVPGSFVVLVYGVPGGGGGR